MARLIKANGEEIHIFPANGKTFTWEEVESYVGGFLYPYGLALENEEMWILANEKNELERPPDLPYNVRASNLFSPFPEDMRQPLYGDVVVTSESQWSDELYHQYREKIAEEEYDPEDDYEEVDMDYPE